MTDTTDTPTAPPETEHIPYFLWLDLETTGLNEKTGKILEVAIVITRADDLTPLYSYSWTIGHDRETLLPMMSDHVISMHLNSGLLGEVWVSPLTVQGALKSIQAAVWNHCKNDDHTSSDKVHLAGSSINFDLRWLRFHLPDVLNLLHYRVVDVSVFKTCFPGLLAQPDGGPAHRAAKDLEYSISQLRAMHSVIDMAYIGMRAKADEADAEGLFNAGDSVFQNDAPEGITSEPLQGDVRSRFLPGGLTDANAILEA